MQSTVLLHRQTPTASFILLINQPSALLHYLLLLSQQISLTYHYISYTSTKITSTEPKSLGCVKRKALPSPHLSAWMMLCIRASIRPVIYACCFTACYFVCVMVGMSNAWGCVTHHLFIASLILGLRYITAGESVCKMRTYCNNEDN